MLWSIHKIVLGGYRKEIYILLVFYSWNYDEISNGRCKPELYHQGTDVMITMEDGWMIVEAGKLLGKRIVE